MEGTMVQAQEYTFAQLQAVLRKASGGKAFSNNKVQKLVGRGVLIKRTPPGGVQGKYEKVAADAYAKELREFYGVSSEEEEE